MPATELRRGNLGNKRRIKALEKKVNDAKNIFTSIGFMGLDENYPEKLKTAITKFLDDSK